MVEGKEPLQQDQRYGKWSWELFREWAGVIGLLIALGSFIANCQHNRFEESLHQESLVVYGAPVLMQDKTGIFTTDGEQYPAMIITQWAFLVYNDGEVPVAVSDVDYHTLYDGIHFPNPKPTIMNRSRVLHKLPHQLAPGEDFKFLVEIHVPLTREVWSLLEDQYPTTFGSHDYNITDIIWFLADRHKDIYGNDINPADQSFRNQSDFWNFHIPSLNSPIRQARFILHVNTVSGNVFSCEFYHYDPSRDKLPEWMLWL